MFEKFFEDPFDSSFSLPDWKKKLEKLIEMGYNLYYFEELVKKNKIIIIINYFLDRKGCRGWLQMLCRSSGNKLKEGLAEIA